MMVHVCVFVRAVPKNRNGEEISAFLPGAWRALGRHEKRNDDVRCCNGERNSRWKGSLANVSEMCACGRGQRSRNVNVAALAAVRLLACEGLQSARVQ